MTHSPEYYESDKFSNYNSAFYVLENDSFLIYPKPIKTVPLGITLYATKKPYDLTSNMGESAILVEPEYHSLIAK